MDWIQINWTAGSLQEARKIARYLVQERFVAQAKIVPWVESIVLLNNTLETSQETLVQFMTTRKQFPEILKLIEKQGNFQILELTAFSLDEVNPEYFNWLNENLSITIGN